MLQLRAVVQPAGGAGVLAAIGSSAAASDGVTALAAQAQLSATENLQLCSFLLQVQPLGSGITQIAMKLATFKCLIRRLFRAMKFYTFTNCMLCRLFC